MSSFDPPLSRTAAALLALGALLAIAWVALAAAHAPAAKHTVSSVESTAP